MKLRSLFLIATSYLFLQATALGQNVYYPIEKGEVWIYNYSEDFISSSGSKSRIEILTRTENIHGKEYFLMQTSIGDGEEYEILQTSYLRNGSNGQVLGLTNPEMGEEQLLLAAAPLIEGKTWNAKSDGQISISTVVGTDENLITPTKSYKNCLVIETEMGDAKIRSYFQKDIGLIASSLMLPDGEKLMQYLAR